jgi:hypothetical protein
MNRCAAICGLLLALAGCGTPASPPRAVTGASTGQKTARSLPPSPARSATTPPPASGAPVRVAYKRAYFGPRCTLGTSGCDPLGVRWDWVDTDGPGPLCDGRQEAVLRATTDQHKRSRCQVTTADVHDRYTGKTINDAPTSSFDVDHVASLHDAWESGAWAWCGGPGYCAKRIAYANDPTVLVLTTASANRSKGDQDPSTWAPASHDGACFYARAYRAIKLRWRLHTTPAQRSAIKKTLVTCQGAQK